MKKSLRIVAMASLVACTCGIAAHGAPMRQSASAEPFKWAPKSRAAQSEWTLGASASKAMKAAPKSDFDHSFDPAENYAYLDMPDGSTWFVTADYDKEVISQSDSYTQYAIKGIKATVYDQNYKVVGRIDEPIPVPEGYAFCSAVQFGAAVTQMFFNTDNNYEIMLMANYRPVDDFGADPYTYVYSLKGADENAPVVETLKGYYTSAINNAADRWSEDFFMEFFAGEEYTEKEMFYTFDILTKATYQNKKASVLESFKVDMMYVMSDGDNESLPVLLNSKGSDLYVAVARYEKTFFLNPFDYTDDRLSPDNNYVVTLYHKEGQKMVEQSVTKIPCGTPSDGFMIRSYCLGQFQGIGDLSFDFTEDKSPAFVISVHDSNINREESFDYFAVYDVKGDVINTFGEDNGGYLALSSVTGQPEQYCFLELSAEGDYGFQFYDYPSLERKAFIAPSVYTGTEDLALSLSLDRVPGGGSYRYAISSQHGNVDANDNVYHQVAWFDADGNFLKVDRLNAGKDVYRIMPYISANGLDPFLFNTDASNEYMILVQRGTGSASQTATELCVVNDREEMLFRRVFDVYDSSISVSLSNLASNPAIWISYDDFDDNLYHNEFVSLPLNKFEGSGTAEDPYIIKSAGDFGQIRNNLTGNYRFASDIDFDGVPFTVISGTFLGTIDGAGHTMRGLNLVSSPLFKVFGNASSDKVSVIRDLTIADPVVSGTADAIIASGTYNARFENVHIARAKVDGDNTDDFGSFASSTFATVFDGCSFIGDINLPDCGTVGGLVADLGLDCKVNACYVKGSIEASSGLGGIASYMKSTASVTDSHVNASLKAKNSIGGIASNNARGYIGRCVVEGSITATEAGQRMNYLTYQPYKYIHVGGIAGELASNTGSLSGDDTPVASYVIENNLVALDAITIPEGEELLATAHRIVGRSAVNDDPEIIGEKYDPELQDWVYELGDPAAPEAFIRNNHSLSSLSKLHADTEADHTTTEGKDVTAEDLSSEFFTNLGFKFDGYTTAEPWVNTMSSIPGLWYESTVGQALYFTPAEITVTAGKTESVILVLEGIEFDALSIESSDEAACMVTPVELTEDGNAVIEISVSAEGTYTVTATTGAVSAELKVFGRSGIGQVGADAAGVSYDGGVVLASGCRITLWNISGSAVAYGNGSLSTAGLVSGVYVAEAVAADGTRHTLKIAVK